MVGRSLMCAMASNGVQADALQRVEAEANAAAAEADRLSRQLQALQARERAQLALD